MSLGIHKTTYDIDELILDADLYGLKEKCDKVEAHIRASVPDEILFTQSGEPNVRLKYGAFLFQIRGLRAIIRGFLDE